MSLVEGTAIHDKWDNGLLREVIPDAVFVGRSTAREATPKALRSTVILYGRSFVTLAFIYSATLPIAKLVNVGPRGLSAYYSIK